MAVARILLGDQYADGQDRLMLRAWRGGWWQWRTSYWSEVDQRVVRAAAYHFTESAFYMDGDKPRPWAPNRHKVADLLEALQAVTHTDIDEAPSWIERRLPPANETVSFANGLLHVPTRTLLPHDPNFFNQINVPFEYCDTPPKPERWWQFLDELWSSDVESIEALQQFFGYVLAGATNQHKILLLVGPARSGKGTIARVLTSLIGRAHCCSPTLANLGENFGLEPLIGKSLAVIGDVRLGGRNDHAVVERLLSISGEDMLTIDRKYREAWTGQLGTRFMLISNELPRFGDASGAIASRFVVLTLSRSWLGAEDKELTSKLLGELPGILGWALDGMESLMGLGRFKEPQSSIDSMVALMDLAAPVSAFVRDRCLRGGGYHASVDEIWDAWKRWAIDNGHGSGTKQVLGRNLRAVIPGLRVTQIGSLSDRHRAYEGLGLK